MTIEHIAITTADIDRLRQFYTTYFGMEAETEITGSTGARIIFMHSPDGGARIELMQRPQGDTRAACQTINHPAAEPSGYAHLAFSVGSEDAVNALIQRLQASGVTILRRPQHTPSGTLLATIADPDGNPLEIVP